VRDAITQRRTEAYGTYSNKLFIWHFYAGVKKHKGVFSQIMLFFNKKSHAKEKKCMIGACPAHLIACGCLTFKIVGPHNLVGLGTPHPGSFWPKYPVFHNFQFQKLKIFLLDISFYLILMSYIPLIFPRNIRHSINF